MIDYFLYAGTDRAEISSFEKTLNMVDRDKHVVVVSNGFDLITYLQKVPQGNAFPSLIIVNKQMNRLDGKSTLELLKTDDMYCLIPTVMLASENSTEEQDLCSRLGTDLIMKPASRGEWVTAVKKMCSTCT